MVGLQGERRLGVLLDGDGVLHAIPYADTERRPADGAREVEPRLGVGGISRGFSATFSASSQPPKSWLITLPKVTNVMSTSATRTAAGDGRRGVD